MGQLIVRNLADDLIQALRRRAARHGRSAEAEHREILRETLGPEVTRRSFKSFLTRLPDVGEDDDFAPRRDMPRKIPS
ncbi:MAG: FitA-like ribbon-helix-helix domain-containing protein [Planctomycetia bacterium]